VPPRWLSGLVVAVALSACRAQSGGDSCSTLDEQCGGATDCYAVCVCKSGDGDGCRSGCDLAADAPLFIDVSGWSADPDEADLLVRINAERSQGGCCATGSCFSPVPALATNDALTAAARRHALDMAERSYFSHDTPEGLTVEDRLRAAGYRGCVVGENLAAAYPTTSDVITAWLASTDHCENLFWPAFTGVGIARAVGPASGPGTVWVADFGG
jgi:hypothetical protein